MSEFLPRVTFTNIDDARATLAALTTAWNTAWAAQDDTTETSARLSALMCATEAEVRRLDSSSDSSTESE